LPSLGAQKGFPELVEGALATEADQPVLDRQVFERLPIIHPQRPKEGQPQTEPLQQRQRREEQEVLATGHRVEIALAEKPLLRLGEPHVVAQSDLVDQGQQISVAAQNAVVILVDPGAVGLEEVDQATRMILGFEDGYLRAAPGQIVGQ
jgi:hypothetical protein